MWEVFGMGTLRDYHDTYVTADTTQLADVFKNFRKLCMKVFQLDPGLVFDALFKHTRHRQELVTDFNLHMMFEACVRGGYSGISKRFARANNKYMKDYDPEKEDIFIVPLDANNLYGLAMSQTLPIGGYKEATEEKIRNWRDIQGGFIGCFDLGYPKHLHNKHNDLPLAPENRKVGKGTTLIASLHDKKRYTCHHQNLKYHVSEGMEVQKVHWIVKFDEAEWMKPYILINTRLRAQATNEF